MRIAVTLLLILCACFAFGQELLRLRMGTLSLDVPSTWKFTGSGQRVEGRGPDGERVIANYRLLKPGAPREVLEHHWTTLRGFASDRMPGLASRNGQVIRPVTELSRADGRVQFSSMSQAGTTSREHDFLQYLLGSPRLMVYMTVEGEGSAPDAARRFEEILASQRWEE